MMKASDSLPRVTKNQLRVTFELGSDMLGAPIRYFDALGDTFATRVLGDEYVMTRDPVWISEILVKNSSAFIKDKVTRGVSRLLGQGLLTNDAATWRPRRKAMQPHFQPAALYDLIEPMRKETEVVLRGWGEEATIDLHAAMVNVALRCALRALFGIDPDIFAEVGKHTRAGMDYFAGLFGTMVPLPLWLPTGVNRRFLRARRALRSTLGNLVDQARRRGAMSTPLDGLFSAEQAGLLSQEEMLDEAMTFLLAGHDPSALTLMYTLGALASHPLEQTKVHRELEQTVGPITMEQCAAPSALRRALNESLRLYPASWAIGREPREEVAIGQYVLAPGTQIVVHQWAAHRHPAWFSQAHLFQPDRWLGDLAASLPKGLYVPWGTGPRVCIGNHFSALQMMVSLRTILSQYRLVAVDPFPPPLTASITALPRRPVLVRVLRLRSLGRR